MPHHTKLPSPESKPRPDPAKVRESLKPHQPRAIVGIGLLRLGSEVRFDLPTGLPETHSRWAGDL